MICPICKRFLKLFDFKNNYLVFICNTHFSIHIYENEICLVVNPAPYKILISSRSNRCSVTFNDETVYIPKFYIDLNADLAHQIENILLLS